MSRGAAIIAEDDASLRELMSDVLRDMGFTVFAASNGPACLRLLNRITPRLLLLDIEMPLMDGVDVCSTIRRGFPMLDAPILFVTAYGTLTTLAEAMQAGGTDFLVKPFTLESLRTKVSDCMRGRRGSLSPETTEMAAFRANR